jgi:hypothetical protein
VARAVATSSPGSPRPGEPAISARRRRGSTPRSKGASIPADVWEGEPYRRPGAGRRDGAGGAGRGGAGSPRAKRDRGTEGGGASEGRYHRDIAGAGSSRRGRRGSKSLDPLRPSSTDYRSTASLHREPEDELILPHRHIGARPQQNQGRCTPVRSSSSNRRGSDGHGQWMTALEKSGSSVVGTNSTTSAGRLDRLLAHRRSLVALGRRSRSGREHWGRRPDRSASASG